MFKDRVAAADSKLDVGCTTLAPEATEAADAEKVKESVVATEVTVNS